MGSGPGRPSSSAPHSSTKSGHTWPQPQPQIHTDRHRLVGDYYMQQKLMSRTSLAVTVMAAAWLWTPAHAQDRLKAMPGYEQFQKMSREIPGSVKLGSLAVQWKEDG